MNEIELSFDTLCCPCGTGGTLAGFAGGLRPGQRAIGFFALKGGSFVSQDIAELQEEAWGQVAPNWHVEEGFHFGGFAKKTGDLTRFIEDFESKHVIRLDWVYVAKMMYGIYSMIEGGRFDRGSVVVAVITG